jgi:hypothetical protein
MRPSRRGSGRVRAALDRPWLWRVTATLSALLLCGLVLASAQGSLRIIASRPASGRSAANGSPSWEPWCTKGQPREDRKRLAFCARVAGRVLAVTHGPAPGEAHAAVISDFHLLIVRLPDYAPTPARGARLIAIGPLFRARDGQREVQAFHLEAA